MTRNDRLAYWKHFDSFVQELEGSEPKPAAASSSTQVALFNDTDRRPNIGCRLTSQSFKKTVKAAFPGCAIVSNGFRFEAFRVKANTEAAAGC